MDAEEMLTTTRSVRRKLDLIRPVDPADVEACIEIALQAPTGASRQHWRWIVVTDAKLRAGIAEVYRAAFLARPQSAQTMPPPVYASATFLAEHLAEVPVLVLPCLELPKGLPAGNQAGVWGSLLPAAWSYMLAARTRQLGTAWTAVHLDREEEVAALLGLPPHVRQGVMIPTAYTTGGFVRGRREPLAAVLHRNGWQGR